MIALPEQPLAGVDLWLVDLDDATSATQAPALECLDAAELARAGRFHFEHDARRYRASHRALRQLLAQRTGQHPGELQMAHGRYGKPRLAGRDSPHFNLSHSGRWALIGLCDTAPIGVDIEVPRPMDDLMALAERNFSPTEYGALQCLPPHQRQLAFLQCWTRKEACLKALGSGLSVEPSGFEAGVTGTPLCTAISHDAGVCHMAVHSLGLPQGLAAAVARLAEADRHQAL